MLVSPELHEKLRNAFATLQRDQAVSPDWHPNSNDMVRNLVHPSMYPLVYGRSRVFDEEVVGVKDAIDKWAGKGKVIGKNIPGPPGRFDQPVGVHPYGGPAPDYWSVNYQWLPANLAFQRDGSLRFTSYINNLHPTRYPEIYCTIEELIEASLPIWDQCLSLYVDNDKPEGAGRRHSRFAKVMPDNME
jgi:hypothetical protein